jgi:hypothetical protein
MASVFDNLASETEVFVSLLDEEIMELIYCGQFKKAQLIVNLQRNLGSACIAYWAAKERERRGGVEST